MFTKSLPTKTPTTTAVSSGHNVQLYLPPSFASHHLHIMLLLSRTRKVSAARCPPIKPIALTSAHLDGTNKSSGRGVSTIQHSSFNPKAMIVPVTSCPISRTSMGQAISDLGDIVALPSIHLTLDIERRKDDMPSRFQYTWADIFPISGTEDCAGHHPFHSKQHVQPSFPVPVSIHETQAIDFSSASSHMEMKKTAIRMDRHRHQSRPREIGHTKFVRFDSVHIREHSVTIGDHDLCGGPLAMTLDWPHTETCLSIAIDDYESIRERQGRTPRGRPRKREHWERKQLLRHVGGIPEHDLECAEYAERCKMTLQRSNTVTVFPNHHDDGL